MYLPLQISKSMFEHGATTGIVTAFELLNDALQRQPKVFSFAVPGRGFLCQARFFRGGPCGCFVLLRLDGLAFPAPGHSADYNVTRGLGCDAERKASTGPILGKFVRKTDLPKKNGYSLEIWGYNARSL